MRTSRVLLALCLLCAVQSRRTTAQTPTRPSAGSTPAAGADPILGFQPFGLQCGMTAEQVIRIAGTAGVKQSPGGVLELTSTPHPHSGFVSYSAAATPKQGVVMINARGFNASASATAELHDTFIDIRETLSRIYGAPSQSLDLSAGATFWVMGTEKKAGNSGPRHWAAVWDLRPPYPRHIQSIILDAEQGSKFFLLSYECDGIEGVSKSAKAAAVAQTSVPTAFLPTPNPHLTAAGPVTRSGAQDIRLDIKPGLWETTATGEISGVSAPAMSKTVRTCSAGGSWGYPMLENWQVTGNSVRGSLACTSQVVGSSGRSPQWHEECGNANGKFAFDLTLDRVDSEHVTGSGVMKVSAVNRSGTGVQNGNVKMWLTSKWVSSECGGVKPAGAN